ncbi:hypothetical protein AzCIB_1351 [Azoarcus sp. CIB]|nr:hypothetical protein AzCIB_1351 [Azoarcus sp. CIB]
MFCQHSADLGAIHPLHANIGGPMSRTRSVRIASSLLGRDTGHIRCPMIIRLGLEFRKGVDPVKHLHQMLATEGLTTPEALRERFPPPDRPYLCRALADDHQRLKVAEALREKVLQQALLLGLCTAFRYDPSRAVIWTQASLTRGLELYDPAEFYA